MSNTSTQLTINVGSQPNDGTGDPLRDALIKVNTNFTTLFDNLQSGSAVSGQNIIINSVDTGTIISVTGTSVTITDNSAGIIATTEFVHEIVPYGVILLWYGSVASIPSGYSLCNGTNGTPNLTNAFILGSGNSLSPGQTGYVYATVSGTPLEYYSLAYIMKTI